MTKRIKLLMCAILTFYGCVLVGFHVYAVRKGQIILVGQFREDFFWLLFVAAWMIVAIISLIRYKMAKNAQHPIPAIIGVITLALFLLGSSFLKWLAHSGDTYYTFQSPDGEHIIVAYESAMLLHGEVSLYEKTSPFLVEYETVLSVDDGGRPITDGAYQIEWTDDAVLFSVSHYSGRIAYGPDQWAPLWWTAEIELGVLGSNACDYMTYRYADGSLHTEDEITYVPSDSGDLPDQTNTNIQEEELFSGERLITAGYKALFYEFSDFSGEFDVYYGASESDTKCIVIDNPTYVEYLVYAGRSKNEKCGIYVLYRCEKEMDGSYFSGNAEIVDIFAFVNDTEEIVSSGITSWEATGSEEYILSTEG